MVGRLNSATAGMMFAIVAGGCMQTFDAGSGRPHGKLPVDERNPVVLMNAGLDDNWQAAYTMLFAHGGVLKLDAIIIGTGTNWPSIETNIAEWRAAVAAARASGLGNIPDPITSIAPRLVRPDSGVIEMTAVNRSEGALAILDASKRLGLPYRPLVVLTGESQTDVADAYLIDQTVKDRIVVVSSLGTSTASGGAMGIPNGETDPWAESIVAERLRYVQINAFYDQSNDVPDSRLPELPANPLGRWIAAKQPGIWNVAQASDQAAIAALCLPAFVQTVVRMSSAGPVGAGATFGPDLVLNPNGNVWVARDGVGSVATDRFWELLAATASN
jgi:hypothetical protein